MTRIGLLILSFVTLVVRLNAQDDWGNKFNKYEFQKKEVATAYLASTLLPGGGAFYAGDIRMGCLLFAGTLAAGIWVIEEEISREFPIVILVIVKIIDYGIGADLVQDYNRDLRRDLGLALDYSSDRGATLQLSFNF